MRLCEGSLWTRDIRCGYIVRKRLYRYRTENYIHAQSSHTVCDPEVTNTILFIWLWSDDSYPIEKLRVGASLTGNV